MRRVSVFSGLLVSSALWKSQSDVAGGDLFSFFVNSLLFFVLRYIRYIGD
jgi:hypothetical protein